MRILRITWLDAEWMMSDWMMVQLDWMMGQLDWMMGQLDWYGDWMMGMANGWNGLVWIGLDDGNRRMANGINQQNKTKQKWWWWKGTNQMD